MPNNDSALPSGAGNASVLGSVAPSAMALRRVVGAFICGDAVEIGVGAV